MKCQILFSGKNKKNIINLPSAENAQRVVKVKAIRLCAYDVSENNIAAYMYTCAQSDQDRLCSRKLFSS